MTHLTREALIIAGLFLWACGVYPAILLFRRWLHAGETWTRGLKRESVVFALTWPSWAGPMLCIALILGVALPIVELVAWLFKISPIGRFFSDSRPAR